MPSAVTLKRSTAFAIWLLAILVCVAAWSTSVRGAVITFTDRATFISSLGTRSFVSTENFSGNPPGFTPIPVNTQFDVGAFDVFYTTANNQSQPTIALRTRPAINGWTFSSTVATVPEPLSPDESRLRSSSGLMTNSSASEVTGEHSLVLSHPTTETC